LGDVELVNECTRLIADKIKNVEFDYIVGPEVKTVPLLYELSTYFHKNCYIVCRKKIHSYMIHPVTSDTNPPLTINGSDADLIRGKKVFIIDDVVTSGKTLQVVESLVKMCGAHVAGCAAVAKQGDDQANLDANFWYLIKLPLIREH
jgi:adenine phosphoribosyltransferase